MFIDTIRAMLAPGSGPDCRKDLLRQYTAMFKKCSGAVSEWTEKRVSGADAERAGAEVHAGAWDLFYEYAGIMVEFAVVNGMREFCVREKDRPLVDRFLSVLFPDKDYADEIVSRLDYIVKRAFDAAWNEGADPYSPMDTPDSFRRMLSCHLEQSAEISHSLGGKSRGNDDAVASIRVRLLEMAFELSRHERKQPEYKIGEHLFLSALNVLKELGGNASREEEPPRFRMDSAWKVRAALKDHVHLTGVEASARNRNTNLKWKTTCSLKAAVSQMPRKPEKQQPRPLHHSR